MLFDLSKKVEYYVEDPKKRPDPNSYLPHIETDHSVGIFFSIMAEGVFASGYKMNEAKSYAALQYGMKAGDVLCTARAAVMAYNGTGTRMDETAGHTLMRSVSSKLHQSADEGHLYAQTLWGIANFGGIGVPLNLEEGFRYTKMAADRGEPYAQVILYDACKHGYGTHYHLGEALRYLHLAADQHLATAQNRLGEFHRPRTGVEGYLGHAREWFEKGCRQGHPRSIYGLAEVYERIAESIKKTDPAEARYLERRSMHLYWVAAEIGLPGAAIAVAKNLRLGLGGIKQGHNQARAYYILSLMLNQKADHRHRVPASDTDRGIAEEGIRLLEADIADRKKIGLKTLLIFKDGSSTVKVPIKPIKQPVKIRTGPKR